MLSLESGLLIWLQGVFTECQVIVERGIWPRLTMVICIIGPCWHLLEHLCSHQSLSDHWHPRPPHQLKILRPALFWPSVLVDHFAFSLSHLQSLLRSASPLCGFCVPLKDTQETSICSPVPIWNYRELGATAIDPLRLETTHSSFSSVAALLDCCFSDFISAVKAHILLLSDPQL